MAAQPFWRATYINPMAPLLAWSRLLEQTNSKVIINLALLVCSATVLVGSSVRFIYIFASAVCCCVICSFGSSCPLRLDSFLSFVTRRLYTHFYSAYSRLTTLFCAV